MLGDLHTHSNFSDGANDIEDLPWLAARAGLTHLAVADHDTPLAAQFAYANPVLHGVALIPAVELTALDTLRGQRVHLLCYAPDLTPALLKFFKTMAQRRNEATARSMQELEAMYPQFCAKHVQPFSRRGGVTYKTHIMRRLLEIGYTDGIYTNLYKELFGKGGRVLHAPAYESVNTVLALAQEARAVVVLAHPSVYHSMELCKELAQAGRIDGVEIEHPRNTAADKLALYALAKTQGLLMTGGTDFHGLHMQKPLPLGACTTDNENLAHLLALCKARKT